MNFYSIQIVYKMKNLLKTPAFCTIIFLVSNIHNIKKDFLPNVGLDYFNALNEIPMIWKKITKIIKQLLRKNINVII